MLLCFQGFLTIVDAVPQDRSRAMPRMRRQPAGPRQQAAGDDPANSAHEDTRFTPLIERFLEDARVEGGLAVHSIEAYRREEVPLVVPMKLLRHYFRRHPDDYIDRQWYLDPYPEALGLRNTI